MACRGHRNCNGNCACDGCPGQSARKSYEKCADQPAATKNPTVNQKPSLRRVVWLNLLSLGEAHRGMALGSFAAFQGGFERGDCGPAFPSLANWSSMP
jgi:hypothetical protein